MSDVSTTSELGAFVRHDLMTTRLEIVRPFYGALFPEWSLTLEPQSSGGGFATIRMDGIEQGALVGLPDDAPFPPYWLGTVLVEDCEATVARCQQAGGTCLLPALGVPGSCRIAVLEDCEGVSIRAMDSRGPLGRPEVFRSGHFCWDELLTRDLRAARSFYPSVFGWAATEVILPETGPYTLFKFGASDIAGSLPLPDEPESGIEAETEAEKTPACWLTYIFAADIDDRAQRAEALGARTWVTPRDIPGIGRFSIHADPAGALFGLMRLGPPAL